jgi:hypothetical protein
MKEHSSHLVEEGYGKGWLYQDSVFIDFVSYHYQIFQVIATTRIHSGKRSPRVGFRLAGNFKLFNKAMNISSGDYLLLVQRNKGFTIYIDFKEANLEYYHFVLKKDEEVTD